MARPKSVPTYCKHGASGQAYVNFSGRIIYLGKWGSPQSRAEYRRLIAEWTAAGCATAPARTATAVPTAKDITVVELIAAYWTHAQGYYKRPDGKPSGEVACIRDAIRVAKQLYGQTFVRDFGPLALKAVREEMLKLGWSRKYVNKQVGRVRQMFRWATENELAPPSLHHALLAVPGLRKGRVDAPEYEPVEPAGEDAIAFVRRVCAPVIRDMIDVQLFSAMRPGELIALRGCDLDTSGDVWVYRPPHHKTAHHGHGRTIFIGPRAREILERRLKPDVQAFLFNPHEAIAAKAARAKTHRRPDQQENARSTNRVVGDCYDVPAYRRAIARACIRANELARGGRVCPNDAKIIEAFHPHMLRHNAATRLAQEFGIETARVILGHRSLNVTEIYAAQDVAKARRVMGEVG